jgi:hypothetical protein
MSYPTYRGGPVTKRKPELVGVRVIPWDLQQGLFGLVHEFDDGEHVCEVWGSWEETEVAAAIRMQDIRPMSARPEVR